MSLPFPRNQVKVNTVCNSESYNGIYDKGILRSRLYAIDRHVKTIISRNSVVLCKILQVDPSGNMRSTPYTIHPEYYRRNLQITTFIKIVNNQTGTINPEYVIYSIKYKYEFDYQSIPKSYAISSKETIRGVPCKCIGNPRPGWYTFRTPWLDLFHFSFHVPNINLQDKYKFRGAFHLRLEHLANTLGEEPYRAFVYDPELKGPHGTGGFVTWDTMDGRMMDYFTTKDPSLDLDDIGPFLIRNPVVLAFTTVGGRKVDYLGDVVRPIYDMVVERILNPLLATSGVTVQPPVAVAYDPAHRGVVTCPEMNQLRQDPAVQTRQTVRGVTRTLLLGGGRRTRKRRL